MKNTLFYSLLLICILGNTYVHAQEHHAQTPWEGPCPPEGSATTERLQALNILKNKPAERPTTEPAEWHIEQVINAEPHDDKHDFKNGELAQLKGYLVSFKEEGPESCNCKLGNAREKTGDVHMYIGLAPDAPKNECVVVEITPAFKKLHPDYEKYLQNNTPITVTGYLLYDVEHTSQAANTCKSCGSVWRKTCWEIHPIVDIE